MYKIFVKIVSNLLLVHEIDTVFLRNPLRYTPKTVFGWLQCPHDILLEWHLNFCWNSAFTPEFSLTIWLKITGIWHRNFHRNTHELFTYGTWIFHMLISVIELDFNFGLLTFNTWLSTFVFWISIFFLLSTFDFWLSTFDIWL